VGDGALDHLADPVDALILLLGRLARFAVGGLLMRCDHPSSHIVLVADPSGGVGSVEQSRDVQCGHIVHGPREAYSEGGFEDVECECGGDGLFECVQGAAVVGVEDSPGLDVGDGALFRPGGSG